jgi:hypothetical protein
LEILHPLLRPRGEVLRFRAMTRHDARNMRLLAQHPLDGFGNIGEGMCIQLTRDRRRILWLAHESPPKNVTAVDVTNPKKPAVIFQTDLPHERMRSNNLDVVGDILVIAGKPLEHPPPSSRGLEWLKRPHSLGRPRRAIVG